MSSPFDDMMIRSGFKELPQSEVPESMVLLFRNVVEKERVKKSTTDDKTSMDWLNKLLDAAFVGREEERG